MAKAGRPSDYTPEIANEICERLADGESLRSICKLEHLPSRVTVRNWLADERYKTFLNQYARAREEQADHYFEEAIDISDDSTNDYMLREGIPVLNAEAVQRSRLRVDVRKWAAGKLAPKKYGDKIQTELSGPDGGPVQHEVRTAEELAREILFDVAKPHKKD